MLYSKRDGYIFECFSNISELYNGIKDRKKRYDAKEESNSDDYYFTKTHSLEESYDLMIHGDLELSKRINDEAKKIDISKILGNVVKRNSTYNSVVGYQVNVPNYLSGVPTDMIANLPKKTSQKVVNILVNTSVSCSVRASDIEKAGGYYYIVIDLLEKAGYRCNVYVLASYESYDDGYMIVRAKTDKEPFNKEKMAFLLAHPSFHRRINFKWMECVDCKGEPTRDGYGRPITDSEKIKNVVDKELKANFIIWNVQKDYKVKVEDILKNLEKDGIKIGE